MRTTIAARRTMTVSVAVLIALAASCTSEPPTASAPPGTGAGASITSSTVPPPGTHITLDPTKPNDTDSGPPAPETQRVVDDTKGALGLNDVEAACLGQRLQANPSLRDALLAAGTPQVSSRWQEFTDVAADCIRTTTGATNFANGIQAQANGTLSVETLTCLRDSFAKLTAADTAAFIQNALNPGSIDPNVQQKLTDLLAGCGVDAAQLPK